MSTNSRIGILIPALDPNSSIDTAEIRSIYCHWDGYPSHMGLTLHRNFRTVDLVQELLDQGDARLIELTGQSEHYMHSEGGHPADIHTLDYFTNNFLEQYNYIAMPQGGGLVEWVMCGRKPRWNLLVHEILKVENRTSASLSWEELQILYMDRDRIERINPSVLGIMYQACVQSLNNASGTRMANV